MSDDIAAVFEEPTVDESANDAVDESSEVEASEPETNEVESEKAPETTSEDEEISDKLPDWAKKQLKADRVSRQEAQAELRQLREELESLKKPKDEKKEEQIDIFDDPEGVVNNLKQDFQNQISSMRLEMSRNLMMQMTPDYEEVETKIMEAAKSDPALAAFIRNQAANSQNPAKAFYDQGKKYLSFQEMQNIEETKAKMKAEIRAELEKEFQAKTAKPEKTISPSLTKTKGSTDVAPSLPGDPDDLF